MDEVYTCVCKGQAFSIHDGFIRCLRCRKQYELRRFKCELSGDEAQVLVFVADFKKRVEQVKKDIADDSKKDEGG